MSTFSTFKACGQLKQDCVDVTETHRPTELPSRRNLLKAVPGLIAGLMFSAASPNGILAQVPGQNFDVITWKRFANPTTDFTTSSTSWIPSNMPANPNFIKQRSDTYLWMICNLDFVPTTGRSSFMGMYVDGVPVLDIAMAGYPNDILTCSMSEIYFPILAGTHQCQIYVAVEPTSSCTFRTTVCSFTVMEVTMPPRQA